MAALLRTIPHMSAYQWSTMAWVAAEAALCWASSQRKVVSWGTVAQGLLVSVLPPLHKANTHTACWPRVTKALPGSTQKPGWQ